MGSPDGDDARAAGLRYVDDDDPGIGRVRAGREFRYRDAAGRRVADGATLGRIRALAIPPAWIDVWIGPSANGHMQATGRDARGRKQYCYHDLWRVTRDAAKFERTVAFGRALPRLRRRVERDLRRRGLGRERVLAAIVRLLDMTLLRVGNEEYARENRSFGLTTLRSRHARVRGEGLRLSFRGKSGKRHEVGLRDRRLARIVRGCQELPGQRLFQYVDEDGQRQPIDSDDVNDYIRQATGADFSARDFRTWAGSVLCLRSLRALSADAEPAAGASRRAVSRAVVEVARWLGNTPAVCRSAYIHPAIIDDYLDQSVDERVAAPRPPIVAAGNGGDGPAPGITLVGARVPPRTRLSADEQAVLDLLRRVERSQRRSRAAHRPRRRPVGAVA